MQSRRILYIGNKLSSHGKTPTGIEILGPLLEREGFSVRYSSSKKGKASRMLDMFRTLVIHAPKSGCVLIDTYSTANFWYAVMAAAVSRMLGKPYVPILHGGNLPSRLERNPAISRFVFGNSLINVAPSAYLERAFVAKGYNVAVIPNPLVGELPGRVREEFRPKLLWVRSFSDLYNPNMAIETARILSDQFPGVQLCMVGPDVNGNQDTARQLARKYNLDVVFTNRLEKHEWMRRSSDYDFFINTSNIDNTPFSLIEAASLGLLIVSTNVGGIPFLFEDGKSAALVESNDAGAMARNISDMIGNPAKAKSTTLASMDFANGFRWEALREKWIEILKLA